MSKRSLVRDRQPLARWTTSILMMTVVLLSLGVAGASDWASWRGPHSNGTSDETGLVSSWSPEGENLLWRVDFVGRSTPAVFDGRACVIGRRGEGVEMQEVVACYDASSGAKLWEDPYTVYQTTVAYNRLGWASVTGDPETGHLYTQGTDGALKCYDRDGKLVWNRVLKEELGFYSGYGGRTQTPVIDGDLLYIAFVSAGWGDLAPLRHRYYAFDKRTGDMVWVQTPGGFPKDFNTQSVAVIAEIGGVRQLVGGSADGTIYGMNAGSGEKIWSYKLSKRGLNSSVLVDGDRVYASHSEENHDTSTQGRLVCFKAGKGELGPESEIWRIDAMGQGFPSPALRDGRLYVVDNSANMKSIDAATGKIYWEHSIGTVGKGSPVWADGKIYVTEVNGRFHILKPGRDGVETLDVDQLTVPDGRYAEIYGSPAIAGGKVYFTTENGFYCLGAESARDRKVKAPSTVSKPAAEPGPLATLKVVPGDVWARPGAALQFEARGYDADGNALGTFKPEWKLDKISGLISPGGALKPFGTQEVKMGTLTATVGEISASARLRIFPELPWTEDFESHEAGTTPGHWLNAAGKFIVGSREQDPENQLLVKAPRERGLNRSWTYFGTPDMRNYTIEADVLATRQGRRVPDLGVIAGGYTLDLMGAQQQVQVRSWTAMLRMAQQVEFAWEMDTWYRLKLRVDVDDEKATIRGKVWPLDSDEPEAWTIKVEDPLPVRAGSPGLVAYTPSTAYYDNIKVTVND